MMGRSFLFLIDREDQKVQKDREDQMNREYRGFPEYRVNQRGLLLLVVQRGRVLLVIRWEEK